MASFDNTVLRARSAFFLITEGTPEDSPHKKIIYLSPSPYTEEEKKRCTFLGDIQGKQLTFGMMHYAFNTAADAETYRDRIVDGTHRRGLYQDYDLKNIRIEEFALDMRLIDFDIGDQEIMSTIGALDSITPEARDVIMTAFPELKELKVGFPDGVPDVATHDGRPPSRLQGGYIRLTPKERNKFLTTAENFNVQAPASSAFAPFKDKSYYPGNLHGVAEDLGKIKVGLSSGHATEVLLARLYSYNDTFTPETPKPTPAQMKPFAVQVLQNLPQPVGYAILSALESRGLLGRKGPKVIEGTVVNALTTS